jgi:hypothetical protein
MGLFIWSNQPSKIFVWDTPISKCFLWDTQIRPSSQPITEIWIYWSESLWVISFQTSAWNGISIADKNLWATQVYNSGDTLSFANMWYGYQRWNNYWWKYWVNPTSVSTSMVNASTYWPWNYYNSSTFIKLQPENDYWDSSNNQNLWGGTTGTYEAMRWPCDEWWHIPSRADATTLVNAISSITWSVNWTKIKQYCKLPDRLPGITRATAQWGSESRCWITYSSKYNIYSCWMLYLPTNWTYTINENRRMSEGLPCRAFSNTFIQPTTSRIKLNSLQNINLTPTNEINITPNNNGSGNVQSI